MSALTISGPGVAVDGEALLEQAARLESVREDLHATAARLRLLVPDLSARGGSAASAAARVEDTALETQRAAKEAHALANALRLAARGYGDADGEAGRALDALTALLGHRIGAIAPLLAIMLAGSGAAGVGAIALARNLLADPAQRAALEEAQAAGLARLLADPVTIALLERAVDGVDDAILGRLGLPLPLVLAAGSAGLGLSTTRTGAAAVLGGLQSVGALRETATRAVPLGAAGATSTTSGLRGHLDRIPTGDGDERIRVDVVTAPDGAQHAQVYIGPTVEHGLVTDGDPFDMASNIGAVAGLQGGSLRAVQNAIEQAGAAEMPLVVHGYSQGGMVGVQLAEDGGYDVRALVTVGSPTGTAEVPETVPWAQLRHHDDPLPPLGGAAEGQHGVVIGRAALDETTDWGAGLWPGHDLDRYAETASLADASGDQRVDDIVLAVDGLTVEGSTVETHRFGAERLPEKR